MVVHLKRNGGEFLMAIYTVTDTDLASIADAIREKGGTSAPLSFPAGFTDAIDAIPTGGGGSVERKAVTFIDYDGTILYSYTATEAQALTELPENPSHTGLTAQGWNWTLAQIKSRLTDTGGDVLVGQEYTTSSGASEIDIKLDDSEFLEPCLVAAVNGSATVDWGDGTSTDTMTGTSHTTLLYKRHTYAATGQYTIRITVNSGSFIFRTNTGSSYASVLQVYNYPRSRVYANRIIRVRIGASCAIANGAFNECKCLESVIIPGSAYGVDTYAFQNCYSLKSVTIPSMVTNIGNGAFQGCVSLRDFSFPYEVSSLGTAIFNHCKSLQRITVPYGVTGIESSMFGYCRSLQSVILHDSVTSIGDYAFIGCETLMEIEIPDGVTSIGGSAFYECACLKDITIPDEVETIGANAFTKCFSIHEITVPDDVTTIGSYAFNRCESLTEVVLPTSITGIPNNAFEQCYDLREINIPEGVTGIGGSAFSNCYSIKSITIPSTVTGIEAYAFSNCYGMLEYHFLPTTPPTLYASNVFSNIPSGAYIYVPYSADHSILNAYKAASNWSAYANVIREETQP